MRDALQNSSVVLAGVLDVHFQSRPLCPPCSCPRQRQRRPCQICPPSWFCESPPVPARVARQSLLRVPSSAGPPGSARLICECQSHLESVVPGRVARHPRQGRPPSCFSECVPAKSSAIPARVAAKLFLRVPKRRPRQGRLPSLPVSPTKLF